jgi:hypothetical protein
MEGNFRGFVHFRDPTASALEKDLRAISDFFCVHLRENRKSECLVYPLTLPVLPQMHAEKVADCAQIFASRRY